MPECFDQSSVFQSFGWQILFFLSFSFCICFSLGLYHRLLVSHPYSIFVLYFAFEKATRGSEGNRFRESWFRIIIPPVSLRKLPKVTLPTPFI